MRHSGISTLLLSFALTVPANPQEQPLEAGEMVRLRAPSLEKGRIRGRLLAIEGRSLVLDAAGKGPSLLERALGVHRPPERRELRIPLEAVTSLEVARGKKSNWPAAMGMGLAVGGGAALLGGAAYGSYGPCMAPEGASTGDCSHEGRDLVVAGMVAGAAVAVGAGLFMKSDRWVQVRPGQIRVTIAPTHGHGVRVAVSLGS